MSSKSEIGIRLRLDGAQQAEAGLKKFSGAVNGMDSALGAARQSLLSLVPALGAATAVAGVTQMMSTVRETASEIERLSVLAGSTPQEFQRFAVGAKSVNVDMEKFASIMKDTQDKLGDFMQTGGGELKDFFEKIAPKVGVTAEQFKNLSGPQALQLFYSSLQKANLSQKETVFWMESIADDAALLTPLLANNGAEFKRLGDKAEASGAQMSDYLIASSKQLTEQVGELDTQLKAAGNTLAEQLFPALTEAARGFADFSRNSEIAEMAGVGIRTVFETIVVVGANVGNVIRQAGADLVGLYDQAAALAKLDFKGAVAIGNRVDQEAANSRAELAKFEQRIMNASKNAKEYFALSDDLKKAKFGSDEFVQSVEQLAGMQNSGAISTEQLNAALRAVQPAAQAAGKSMSGMGIGAEAAKKAAEEAKKAADALKKSYQDALGAGAGQARDLTAETDKLNAAEKKLADIMAGDAWPKWTAGQREAVRVLFDRNSETIKAQELAKAEAKWMEESAGENLKFAESAFEAADAVEKQVQEQLLANQAIGLTGTALADLEAIRLRDAAAEKARQAAIMDGIDPGIAESYRRQASALQGLADAKQTGAVKQQLADVTQEAKEAWQKTASQIEQSLTDALMRGFESGKGFGQNLVDTVKNMFGTLVLRPVIQAVVNPVAGAVTGVLGLPGAASAGQSMAALNGVNSLSSLYGAMTGGITSSLAGVAASAGSLFGSGALTSFAAGMKGSTLAAGLAGPTTAGATGAMGAGASLAAAMPWIAGGLALASSWSSLFGRKLKDQGIEGMFGGDTGFSGNSYQFYKGGLFRSNKTSRSALDPELAAGLDSQYRALQTSASAMAATLGLGTTAISSFTSSIKLSFQGLTEEQIQAQLAEEFTKVVDSLAAAALGTERYTRAGETAVQTLERLSSSLSTVNGTFDVLGRTLYSASLSGADMASSLVDLMGGLAQYQSTTTAYYQAYYTEAERHATATRQLTASLAALGLSLPTTRAAYRALVEAQDLTTDAGRRTYAALLGLSAQFDSLTPKLDTLAGKFGSLVAGLSDEATRLIDSQIQLSQGAARTAREASDAYRAAMTDLRSAAESILLQRAGGLQSARAAYQAQLTRAQGGDVTAMQALPSLADALIAETKNSSRTAVEFAVASAQVANQLDGVAAVADVLGIGADYQAKLYDVNTSLLEVTREQLASGNLTVDLLQQIQTALGRVDGSIQASAQLTVGTMQTGNGGIVGALVDNAGNVVAGLNSTTVLQLVGMQNQSAAAAAQAQALQAATWGAADWQRQAAYDVNNSQWQATNMLNGAVSSQTVSLGALNQQQIGQLQGLGITQSKALGLTDIVAAATDGSETLLSAVLKRLSAQDTSSADIVGALNLGNADVLRKLAGIESAIRQQSADQAAELQRQQSLEKAQATLSSLAGQQQSTIASVQQGISNIWSLANQYGLSLQQSNGQAAAFDIAGGLFTSAYDWIAGGNPKVWRNFKDAFYSSGGVYDQTYGRAGELQSLASQMQSARDLVRSLGGVPGFSVGGYTGPGGIDEPAGIVHRGEVVWSQTDVARAGGVRAVESLRLGGLPGFADGGAVGLPVLPVAVAQSDDGEVRALLRELVQQNRELTRQVADLSSQVDRMRSENNIGNAQIVGETKSQSRILNKWEQVGMPAAAA
jgi:hypothetical protein